MSLINDALKRTREAQQQNPPTAAGPALKPLEPAEAKAVSSAKSLLYLMVACVVVGNGLLFLAIKDRGPKESSSPASATSPVTPTAVAPVAPVAPAPPVAAAPITTPVQVEPAPIAPAPPTNAAPAPAPAVAVPTPETNAAPAVVFENPKPAPLKLQSIIYNPSRPSAMIGGKFLFLGDRIQGLRVTAIDQETVTLIGDGQTNVLRLP